MRRRLFADALERMPALGNALDAARGVCAKFQGTHPSGRRCNKHKGDKCPMLHVKPGQELSLASNRLHAPFVHMTRDGKFLLVPPLKQACERFWSVAMGQSTPCPITGVDVLRDEDTQSQYVLFTLSKPPPSSTAQDSAAKSWMKFAGETVNCSAVALPDDRIWWHGTEVGNFF